MKLTVRIPAAAANRGKLTGACSSSAAASGAAHSHAHAHVRPPPPLKSAPRACVCAPVRMQEAPKKRVVFIVQTIENNEPPESAGGCDSR